MRSSGPRTATTMQNCVAPASRVARAAASTWSRSRKRVDVDVGVEARRLRAERAVLRAGARLGVDEALELHLGPAVLEAHPVRERDQVGRSSRGSAATASTSSRVSGRRSSSRARSAWSEGVMHAGRLPGPSRHPRTTGKRPPVRRRPSPLAWPSRQQVGVLPPRQHARVRRRENARCAPLHGVGAREVVPVGCSRIRMATVDRPTRAATRMSVATLASRGIGFVRVWVIAAVLGTTFLGNTYQASSSVSNVLFELSPRARCRPCSCRPSSTCSRPARTRGRAPGLRAPRARAGGDGRRLRRRASSLAPQIARLLSTGVHEPHVEKQQIALSTFFLPSSSRRCCSTWSGPSPPRSSIAKRRFVITAIAPIANTVFVVASMVVFRVIAGPDTRASTSASTRS